MVDLIRDDACHWWAVTVEKPDSTATCLLVPKFTPWIFPGNWSRQNRNGMAETFSPPHIKEYAVFIGKKLNGKALVARLSRYHLIIFFDGFKNTFYLVSNMSGSAYFFHGLHLPQGRCPAFIAASLLSNTSVQFLQLKCLQLFL